MTARHRSTDLLVAVVVSQSTDSFQVRRTLRALRCERAGLGSVSGVGTAFLPSLKNILNILAALSYRIYQLNGRGHECVTFMS